MASAILSEQTILCYVTEKQAIEREVTDRFSALDEDGDGAVSIHDIRRGFGKSASMDEEDVEGQLEPEDLYDLFFKRFDKDGDGMLNLNDFRSLYVEMMLCLARGIGGVPVLVALNDRSPFSNAIEHERNTVPPPPAALEKPCEGNRPSRSREAKAQFPRLFVCFCGSRSHTVSR
ncbi:hypothetical protein MLD38_017868 [Melastoma candidum]|uniref:Uncharacterized protein n=1 Tax=Melastoma candidum TaxID=119954 RepID=A0ACB9QS21_9MYRT|nr:hypothetical protein MLD38_017868 [Melastoma candidum]